MPDLGVIVPSRGRPDNIRRLLRAWDRTHAWADADLIVAVDADDPHLPAYADLHAEHAPGFLLSVQPEWTPMVPKLNRVAHDYAADGRYFALGFAGDDHLPQTAGWAAEYLETLRVLKVGMVYGDDGFPNGRQLSSEWAVTANAVRMLGAMVPAPVDHLYCDDAMMELYGRAMMLVHLPHVQIEHLHPLAGKTATDAQYMRFNSHDQYAKDSTTFEAWKRVSLPAQLAMLGVLRAKEEEQ